MVRQIRVLETIDVTPRSNLIGLVRQVGSSIQCPISSAAMSLKAISPSLAPSLAPSSSSKMGYSNVPSLSDLFKLVNDKRSGRRRGGHTGDNTENQLVYSSREIDKQRAESLKAAMDMEICSEYKDKYVIKIKYDVCSHEQKVKDHLAELSIELNLDDEKEIRKYWCQIYIHLIILIFDRVCDIQQLTENYDKFNSYMMNSPTQQKILIFGLYDHVYENFEFISMALFGKHKTTITKISKANILCGIRADDEMDPKEIHVTFLENECNFHEFYSILDGQMANLLMVCWQRLDQYYILTEKKEIFTLDQLPDINQVILSNDVLQIISKRSRVSYIVEEGVIKRFANHLKKYDNFFDYEPNKTEITFMLIKVLRRIILDILTKIYSLCLSDQLYGLNEYLTISDYSFAFSGTGAYNILHKRGKQATGHNKYGEYKKQIKVTRSILNIERLLLPTPLRILFNFRYDITAVRLIEIDCYNLNLYKKNDMFNAFCSDFQKRIKSLIEDFIDRLDRNYIILNEHFDLLPFSNN